jgi:hypothetical protein
MDVCDGHYRTVLNSVCVGLVRTPMVVVVVMVPVPFRRTASECQGRGG